MTNSLVGDVYAKIIEEVKSASTNDFEESGVGQNTLNELQQEWQHKMSLRKVAAMPWDPKPVPPVQQAPPPNNPMPSGPANGLPNNSYPSYENGGHAPGVNGHGRVKAEPGTEAQYHGLPQASAYPQIGGGQGGAARAQQLVEQQFGGQTAASLQQRNGNGLALPGQHAKPQNLNIPTQNQQHLQQQYAHQQQHNQAMQQRQAQHLQQQQRNPQIKVENNGPTPPQGQYQQQQRPPHPSYGQTDGADEAMEEWQAMMAQRRMVTSDQTENANRMMRDRISALSDELESGLMMPLDEQRSRQARRRHAGNRQRDATVTPSSNVAASASAGPSMTQLDGADDEDTKDVLKDEEDDEDAINSDLDDPDDDVNQANEDDEEDNGNSILCTYDKVQRVKNKWKCTLKDGILNTGGKDWVFHKGNGEFEW